MRAPSRKLVWLLFVECILCLLVRSTYAAIPDYSTPPLHTPVQQTFFPSQAIERHQLLDTSLSKRPSSFMLATASPAVAPVPGFAIPYPGPVPVPASVPVPDLFPEPSDPPLTVPFIAPSPGPLTIPIPDGPQSVNLTGNCSLNFTAVASLAQRTAFDCADPLAAYVGVVICCPQFDSLLRIMQGQHMLTTGALALNDTEADYCFEDTMNILVSSMGNSSVPSLCKVTPSNLTVASCPVTTMAEFEQLVNTTLLLDACEVVDPIKECTTQTCQSQIENASRKLAQGSSRTIPQQKTVDECESLALSWLASRLTPVQANSVFRTVMSCSVNKVCPLEFSDTSDVAGSCRGSNPSNESCCKSLDEYLQIVQKQMLITNQQAYRCAANLSRRLQNQGVTTDIYSLCDIDLRDFSLQALGTEGCLLPSQPTDVNATAGITFYCDLNDNIAAQWPRPAPANVSSPAPSAFPPDASSTLVVGSIMLNCICALAVSTLLHMRL